MSDLTLALDCSGESLSVALLGTEKLLAEMYLDLGVPHSRTLMSALDQVLVQAGVGLAEIERLALCRGPGSFSSLRIGMAAMQGLAHSLGRPLYAFVMHDLLAAALDWYRGELVVVTDARRRQVYWSHYDCDGRGRITRKVPFQVADPAAVVQELAGSRQPLFIGGGAGLYRSLFCREFPGAVFPGALYARPRLEQLLRFSWLDEGVADPAAANVAAAILFRVDGDCAPLYIRPSDAEINQGRKGR